uniref:Uncharacterized protein n=1 Tax=Oryza glumipatula TaxID=40148 RepID=A0A0D9Y5F7_9ORYZ
MTRPAHTPCLQPSPTPTCVQPTTRRATHPLLPPSPRRPPLPAEPSLRLRPNLLRARAAAAASTDGRVKQEEEGRRERMVKGRPKPTPVNAPAEVVFDPSAPGARRPRRPGAPSSSSSTGEWHNFMGSSLSDMYRKPAAEKSDDTSDDDEEPDIDIGKLLKDVELFGASTWKERKQLENRKERLLGIFRKRDSKNSKAQKIRPEDRVLRATQGHFKNGILDVKHLLAPPKPSGRDAPEQKMRMGKKNGKGKQKGGRRKRR